jgi:His/Glu/Gln/Arg/opine family amino acid ABC transporter permease subunit
MSVDLVEHRAPPDRGFRYFIAHQNRWSWTTLGLGAATLLTMIVGTIAVLTSYGWTNECPEGVTVTECSPTDSLAAGLTSGGLQNVLLLTIVLAAATWAVAFVSWRSYENKPSKEATVAGIVLAGQGLVLAGATGWFVGLEILGFTVFQGSDVPRFARNFLDFSLIAEYLASPPLPDFLTGAKNTLILSLAGAAIGFIGGLFLALFTMSKRGVVRAPARLYINFFRGTPLIWQISFAGIGVVPALRLDISPYWVAILVLGLNLAAYSSEVYRAGIQSIERGQMEASRTLGLSYLQSLQYVIVPQAIRRVIPPLLNEFVILIKDTSLVSVLGLALSQKELLGVGRTIYSNTFDATAWLGAAGGFLIITLPMIRIVTIVENRMRSGLTSAIG